MRCSCVKHLLIFLCYLSFVCRPLVLFMQIILHCELLLKPSPLLYKGIKLQCHVVQHSKQVLAPIPLSLMCLQEDMFDLDKIFVPINTVHLHWQMACICLKTRTIEYYDSFRGTNPNCMKVMLHHPICVIPRFNTRMLQKAQELQKNKKIAYTLLTHHSTGSSKEKQYFYVICLFCNNMSLRC